MCLFMRANLTCYYPTQYNIMVKLNFKMYVLQRDAISIITYLKPPLAAKEAKEENEEDFVSSFDFISLAIRFLILSNALSVAV